MPAADGRLQVLLGAVHERAHQLQDELVLGLGAPGALAVLAVPAPLLPLVRQEGAGLTPAIRQEQNNVTK